MDFSQGDIVALLNSKDTGTVIRSINPTTYLIRLDDGFELPIKTNELVIRTRNNPIVEADQKNERKVNFNILDHEAKRGLAFVSQLKNEWQVHLVNFTGMDVAFAVSVRRGLKWKSMMVGHLAGGGATLVSKFNSSEVDLFHHWHITLITTYKEDVDVLPKPLETILRLKEVQLAKSEEYIPILDTKGVWLPITQIVDNVINMPTPPKLTQAKVNIQVGEVKDLVDLHVEEVITNYHNMSAPAILKAQLDHFETMLERAIALHLSKITFIHGIGNGVLKSQIGTKLQNHRDVLRFEEADHKRFGAGATLVFLSNS